MTSFDGGVSPELAFSGTLLWKASQRNLALKCVAYWRFAARGFDECAGRNPH